MSILYPLMALGMLAAAVPIWLHLRRRDEKHLVEFSTLRFLDDQPLARARPLWPRNWPLLLLRLAALLLLVAAFTWPYLEGEETVIVEESRVYILDNTLSHQVDDAFTGARDRVAKELAREDVRTQIGVVELSSTARVLVRFGDDKTTAAEKLRRLETSSTRGAFIDAFRSASEMLKSSLGAERRIVLLSDSQANQWTLGAESPPFLDDVEVELPRPIETTPANLSLSGPRARRVVREGRNWIEAGVVLTAYGSPEDATIIFRSGGREMAREEIQINVDDSGPQRPGVVLAEWEADPDEWVLGEVVIDGYADALEGDNRVVFSLPPLRPGRIELIANSLFLRRALDPGVMQGRWESQLSDPQRMADRDSGQTPDVLCVESHTLTSSVVRETIRDDLSNGRGVMLMVNQVTPLIAGFLRDLGIEFESSQSSDPSTFRYVFAEHPIFAPFRSAELGNLAEVKFTNYRRLKVRDAIPLAFSASGDPLVFEVNAGPGRMLVFAFAFERRDTNWPIHPTFIPLLDKSMHYLRGETITTTAYEPGESVVWDLPPGTSARQAVVTLVDPATLKSPNSSPDPIRVDVRDRQASFQLPSKAGHYAVRYDDADQLTAMLDVNPSPLESELIYESEPAAVTAWQQVGDDIEIAQETGRLNGMELTTLEALQQQYAWYLLVAAVAAFVCETVYRQRRG